MIDRSSWSTPDGWKAGIARRERELLSEGKPVDSGRGEQVEPAFPALSRTLAIAAEQVPFGQR